MRRVSLGWLAWPVLGLSGAALGQESVLKNDFLINGSTAAIQAGFVVNEAGASRFRMPTGQTPEWQVKRVQIFWKSLFPPPGAPAVVQDSVSVWLPLGGPNGTSPAVRIFESDPPQMVDGFLNEFDFGLESPPILVPAGSNFFAGLVFSEAPSVFAGPSVVTDTAGCQPGTSWVYENGFNWRDLCTFRDLFGRPPSGTFVIRVVVAPYTAPTPPCAVDFNQDGFQNQEDLGAFITAFLDESVPPGPFGLPLAPCPQAPAPYNTLGYQCDFNQDCAFDQEDLIGYITEFFNEDNGCQR